MSKFDLNHRFQGVVSLGPFISQKVEVLLSIFLKWSRHWYQNVKILKKWFHNFCTNLVLTIYTKTFLCYDRNKKPNFAKIKLEMLQSTLIRSRDWYQKDNVLKKWLYKFCQNLTLTIHIKEMSRLLAKRSNLANIKLEILQSIFLKWSRDLYQNVKILKT